MASDENRRELDEKVTALVAARFGGDYRAAFDHYDADGNGVIDSVELKGQGRFTPPRPAASAQEEPESVGPVRNVLQVLRLPSDQAVREQAQATTGRQITHMVRLIDDLLGVSRISLPDLHKVLGEFAQPVGR